MVSVRRALGHVRSCGRVDRLTHQSAVGYPGRFDNRSSPTTLEATDLPGETEDEPDWYVPGDFPTIQQAIGNASAGETILVAAGTYYGSITSRTGSCSAAKIAI